MSAQVEATYKSGRSFSAWARRLIIVAVGCPVMAMSGGGLAGYLSTAAAGAAPSQPLDAPPLN